MKVRTKKRKRKPISSIGTHRLDPTRTITLRRSLERELAKRFARLRLDVYELLVTEDALGLRQGSGSMADLFAETKVERFVPVDNARWSFLSLPEKVKGFLSWLKDKIDRTLRGRSEEELLTRYAELGLRKGAARSFNDANRSEQVKAHLAERMDFYQGTREQFLRSAFTQPIAIDKIRLLAARSFTDLKNVTEDMSTKMSRILTDGLVQGKGPREVARDLAAQVDLSKERALLIARTEMIRAHADGQLMALEQMGVQEVGVQAEWSTTGDAKVCPLCKPLDGVIFTLEEAKGKIPYHPG